MNADPFVWNRASGDVDPIPTRPVSMIVIRGVPIVAPLVTPMFKLCPLPTRL